jgi:carbon-monoxide dehydrogenase medium subunit
MYPTKYHKPASVSDAVALLATEGAKVLSGGQTLLPTMKQHLAAPSDLVDVRGIAELNGISPATGRSPSGRPRAMPMWPPMPT